MTPFKPSKQDLEHKKEIVALFPNLPLEEIKIIGDETPQYNCIAYAAGDDTKWWEPGAYWPSWATLDKSLGSLVEVFSGLGYTPCANCDLEPGYQKVALYADGENMTHVALQTANGRWRSKIGQSYLIEHPTPQSLNSEAYGEVKVIMRRPVPQSPHPTQ